MIAGVVKDLLAEIRILATGLPKVSGAIYVPVRLELDGDTDDGKYWDTSANAGAGGWVAGGSITTGWPTASYGAAGDWLYQLPAAATTSKTSATKPGRISWRMTDNATTPASETASSPRFEEMLYSNTAAEAATGAAASVTAGVTLATGTHTGAVIPTVNLVNTLTTYTGNTPQTGDVYTRVGAGGAGLTALGDARIANLNATVASRAAPGDQMSLTDATIQRIWDFSLDTLGAAGGMADFLFTNILGASGVRSAIGLAVANLDAQLGTIASSASSAASSSSSAASSASTAATQASAAATSAADLQARTPAALVSGRMDASVGAFPLVIDTGKDGAAVLKDLLGMVSGDIAKSGSAYTFKDRGGSPLFTLTLAASSRTRS